MFSPAEIKRLNEQNPIAEKKFWGPAVPQRFPVDFELPASGGYTRRVLLLRVWEHTCLRHMYPMRRIPGEGWSQCIRRHTNKVRQLYHGSSGCLMYDAWKRQYIFTFGVLHRVGKRLFAKLECIILAVLKMMFNLFLGPPSSGGSRGKVRTVIS